MEKNSQDNIENFLKTFEDELNFTYKSNLRIMWLSNAILLIIFVIQLAVILRKWHLSRNPQKIHKYRSELLQNQNFHQGQNFYH